jgi:hypothetical protein
VEGNVRKIKLLVAGLLLVSASACCCPTKEDKTLVSTMSAVGQNNLKKWATLSDAQKLEAQKNMVGAACVLDHNLNGAALPSEFAPVTSGK